MPEIKPDRSDRNRCVSIHWNLPVQCVLPGTHRQNDHEAWHPQTGNRLRYRRSMGTYSTKELHHGEWHDLHIPPPGGYCNDQYSDHYSGQSVVRCTGQYGHGWNHRAVVDGCTYSWNTPIPKALNSDQLNSDVTQLRGLVVQLAADNADLAAKLDLAERQLQRLDKELVRLRDARTAVLDACDKADQQYPTTGSPRNPAIHISDVRRAAGQTTAVTA